jgi:hypothetical protein
LQKQSIYCLFLGSAGFSSRTLLTYFGLGLVIGLFISHILYGLIAQPLGLNKQGQSPGKDTQGEIVTFTLDYHLVSRRYPEKVLTFGALQSSSPKALYFFLIKKKIQL